MPFVVAELRSGPCVRSRSWNGESIREMLRGAAGKGLEARPFRFRHGGHTIRRVRPVAVRIGLTTYRETAAWGAWTEKADLCRPRTPIRSVSGRRPTVPAPAGLGERGDGRGGVRAMDWTVWCSPAEPTWTRRSTARRPHPTTDAPRVGARRLGTRPGPGGGRRRPARAGRMPGPADPQRRARRRPASSTCPTAWVTTIIAVSSAGSAEHRVSMAAGTLLDDGLRTRRRRAPPTTIRLSVSSATAWSPPAWTEDGTVEAVTCPGRAWVHGVQWHPEVARRRALFAAFVSARRPRAVRVAQLRPSRPRRRPHEPTSREALWSRRGVLARARPQRVRGDGGAAGQRHPSRRPQSRATSCPPNAIWPSCSGSAGSPCARRSRRCARWDWSIRGGAARAGRSSGAPSAPAPRRPADQPVDGGDAAGRARHAPGGRARARPNWPPRVTSAPTTAARCANVSTRPRGAPNATAGWPIPGCTWRSPPRRQPDPGRGHRRRAAAPGRAAARHPRAGREHRPLRRPARRDRRRGPERRRPGGPRPSMCEHVDGTAALLTG